MIFYHGTDEQSFNEIMRQGFKKGKLTNSPEQALEYAKEIAKEKNLNPAVCLIDTLTDTLILRTDYHSIKNPSKHILYKHGLKNKTEFSEFINSVGIEDKNWRTSLKYSGVIQCDSWISPSVIKIIY